MTENTTPLTPLEARRKEVAQYEQNIAMYKQILESLPTEWPAHLEQYRNTSNQHKAIAQIEDMDDVELVSKLWNADGCKAAIRSETVELTKSRNILAVLESQQA